MLRLLLLRRLRVLRKRMAVSHRASAANCLEGWIWSALTVPNGGSLSLRDAGAPEIDPPPRPPNIKRRHPTAETPMSQANWSGVSPDGLPATAHRVDLMGAVDV